MEAWPLAWDPASPTIRRPCLPCSCLLYVARRRIALARGVQEFTWFALGASVPLVSMDAGRAAHQIIEAVRGRRAGVILTPAGQIAAQVSGLLPGIDQPGPASGRAATAPRTRSAAAGIRPGPRIEPSYQRAAFGWLTALGRAAARQPNHRQRR